MIARWNFKARFGYKTEALKLIKDWNEQIGSQTDIDIGCNTTDNTLLVGSCDDTNNSSNSGGAIFGCPGFLRMKLQYLNLA